MHVERGKRKGGWDVRRPFIIFHISKIKKLFLYIKLCERFSFAKKYILLFCRAATALIDLLTRCYHHHHSFTISKKSLFYVCLCVFVCIQNNKNNILHCMYVCVCVYLKPISFFCNNNNNNNSCICIFLGREQNVRKKKRLMVTAIPRGKHHFSPDQ